MPTIVGIDGRPLTWAPVAPRAPDPLVAACLVLIAEAEARIAAAGPRPAPGSVGELAARSSV